MRGVRGVVATVVLAAVSAAGQVIPEREVELTQQLYDNGKYQEALHRSADAMAISNFSEVQRVKLHELAGLSAFNLGQLPVAREHFKQVLLIDPDAQLDPFAVPPAAIKAFEAVRKDSAEALNLRRQQLALQAEQERRAASQLEQKRREDEERRRQLEGLAQKVTVRTIEKRSMLVNFIPFGAGQFQQGRVAPGVAFAVTEAVMAITSIISFFAINALYADTTINLTDRLTDDGTFTATIKRIPADRQIDYQVWSVLKFATGGLFYALWAGGTVEAMVHHQGEVVTETQQALPPPTPPRGALELAPSAGGLGAALRVRF